MNYIISEERAKQLGIIFNRMASIEVKGDSVEHLFACRALLKEVVESLVEEKTEKDSSEKD